MKTFKSFITQGIGVVAVIALVCSSYPAKVQAKEREKTKQAHKASMMAGEPLEMGGVVKSVDTKANKLVVERKMKNKVEDMTFTVNNDTQIKSGDKSLALKDIKAGDKVGVEYNKQGNQMVATEILVGVLRQQGVVQTIDTQANRLILNAQGQTMTFTLAPDIKIMHGKTPGAITDIKPGDKVRVLYTEDTNQNIANGIVTQ